MEVIQLLSKVKSLNDYVLITQDIKTISEFIMPPIETSISILKNIRSYELKYFKKYSEHGAAILLINLLMGLPETEAWDDLGTELVNVIQYWLEALRTHLIFNNTHWWSFLSTILNITQQLYLEHDHIGSWLVERTGERLLDLATREEPSIEQRYRILQCFNKLCSTASRDLRYAYSNKFETYLAKLASRLPACGDVMVQHAMVETLVRWLLPRHARQVRQDAAARWFPSALYTADAVQVFVENQWLTFFKDARCFLNAQNKSNDAVVSVLCTKLLVGDSPILTGSQRNCDHWLDFNCGSSCISLMLEHTLYKALKVRSTNSVDYSALLITESNTESAKMYSGSHGILIFLRVTNPLEMLAAEVLQNKYIVSICVTPHSAFDRVDNAMRTIFDKKYQLLTENYLPMELSQIDRTDQDRNLFIEYSSAEDTRFSIPPAIKRRNILEQKASATVNSVSTVSTPTLVQEVLKDLPDCLSSSLSNDKEIERPTPTEQGQSAASKVTVAEERHRQMVRRKPVVNKSQTTQGKKAQSPANTVSPKKTPNIIDLLAEEALQYSRPEDTRYTHDHNSNVIDSAYSPPKTRSRRCDKREYNHKPIFICDATTDESSTAFVENTPAVHVYTTNRTSTVTLRKKNTTKVSKDSNFVQQTFDNKTVETFFSQHCAENKHGDLVVSPTLARRVNKSNSKSCGSFTLYPPVNIEIIPQPDFNYIDVAECLTSVINIVCDEKPVERLSEHLDQNNTTNKEAGPRLVPLEDVSNTLQKVKNKHAMKPNKKTKPVKAIKKRKTQKETPKNNNKLNLKFVKKNTSIGKRASEMRKTAINAKNIIPELPAKKSSDKETPVNKTKRKLYSHKDDDILSKSRSNDVSLNEVDCELAVAETVLKTPSATPYKELEKMPRTAVRRQLRNRKEICLSPKTEKNNRIFDALKKSIDGEEQIVLFDKKLADKGALYNFTGSSDEDENFKPRRVTRNSLKAIQRGRNKANIDSDNANEGKKIAKRIGSRSKQQRNRKLVTPTRELVDERLRETIEVLDTSLILESRLEDVEVENEPAHKKPRMEIVSDDKECEKDTGSMKRSRPRTEEGPSKNVTRRSKSEQTNRNETEDDAKTMSPLPLFEIETVHKIPKADDSPVILLERLEKGNFNVLDITQNLMSESEQVITSPTALKITDEFPEAAVNTKRRLRRLSQTSSDRSSTSANKKTVIQLDKLDIHQSQSHRTLRSSGSQKSKHAEKSYTVPETSNHSSKPLKLIFEKTPYVTITMLSQKEIDRHVPPRNTSDGLPILKSVPTPTTKNKKSTPKISKSPNIGNSSPILVNKLNIEEIYKSPPLAVGNISINSSEAEDLQSVSGKYSNLRKFSKAESSVSSKHSNIRKFSKADSPLIPESSKKRSKTQDEGRKYTKNSNEIYPSSSMVDDWLGRTEFCTQTSTEDPPGEDVLTTILKRLNKRLPKIHYSTKASLINLLRKTHSEVRKACDERTNAIKATSEMLVSAVDAMVTGKCAQLENKFKEIDKKLISDFEATTCRIISDDFNNVCDLMNMIKEDVKTAVRHSNSKNDEEN